MLPVRVLLRVCAALGLGAASGLNATLPAWIVSAVARAGVIHLQPPFTLLGSHLAFYGLGGLMVLELLADMVKGLDNLLHMLLFPLAVSLGTILAGWQLAATGALDPGLAMLVGLLIGGVSAGLTHTMRSVVRGPLTVLSVPIVVVSLAEDLGALALTGAGLGAPILVPVIVLLLLLSAVLLVRGLIRATATVLRVLRRWLGGWNGLADGRLVGQAPAAQPQVWDLDEEEVR